ncbi:hypothetical protein [Mucilaginibacter lappiensis]|uniref:Uncharacterized protein n=1 Tax=Mucilaginibacter lappiensis TaxID=354630 RepID=A0A841JJ71_9SPHI|nr:hypothetical protein [Mucilaginibacter lappiensis]MBB6110428.1 hypothetical protein [Mucilaginibacter lappiensis]MBB6128465.1 hypothetical protein [Mucilaginibacter lappiensis]
MMDFKITFPAGYNETNELDDNIDVHIILENGNVFVATLFTLANIQKLMTQSSSASFWASDMIIAANLSREGIRDTIQEVIDDEYLEHACTHIGRIEKRYAGMSFDQIPDMADGYKLIGKQG